VTDVNVLAENTKEKNTEENEKNESEAEADGANESNEAEELAKSAGLTKSKDGYIKKGGVAVNTYSVLYKKLIIRALAYLFDAMKEEKHHDACVLSGKYLSLAVYRLCGLLYSGVVQPPGAASIERQLIAELTNTAKIGELGAPLGEYEFDNVYLNNIISNIIKNENSTDSADSK